MSAAVILNLGVLIGMTILASVGVFPWSFLGSVFWSSVAPTTLSAFFASIGFTMYETLQYKAQYETAQARLSSLESRLRPHFLFNTLNSIMALIPEDPDAAERMTERLSALLRYSLDATLQNTVRLEQELKVAADYLEIEKTRFGGRLAVFHRCARGIDVDGCSSVQPADSRGKQREVWRRRDPCQCAATATAMCCFGFGIPAMDFRAMRSCRRATDLHNLKDRLDALWGSNASVEFPREEAGTTVQVSRAR